MSIFDPGPLQISDYISDINRLIIGLNQSNSSSIPLVLMPFGASDMMAVLNKTVQALNSLPSVSIPLFSGPQDTSAFLSLLNTLNILGAGIGGNPILAKDLFAGTNGTALAAHTMDIGTGWTQQIGTFALNGSGAVQDLTEVSAQSLATFNLGASDGRYKMTMTPSTSGNNGASPGMVFRYSDSNNYWLVTLFAGNAGSSPQAVQLFQKAAGTFTQQVSFPLTLGSTAHDVEVWFKGPTITLTVDGANETTFVSTFNQTATICGIRGSISGAAPARPLWSNMSVVANSPALSWPQYTRFVSNPILVTGTVGGWEEKSLAAPQPFFDPVGNQWILQYSGFSTTTSKWGTGIAKNPDITNLGGWVKSVNNPLFPDALDGVMLYFQGAFWLWAATNVQQGHQIFAWKKNSQNIDDGGAWTIQNGGAPVLVGGPGAYDAGGVYELDAQIVGSTLVIYYMGNTAGAVRTVSSATSTDGINFTKSGLNPLFTNAPFSPANGTLGAIACNPTAAAVGAPQFFINDGQGDSKFTSRYSDQVYFDGTNYHRRAQIIVPIGTTWEKTQVFDTNQVLVNGVWYMFYSGAPDTGGNSPTSQIGAATAPYTGIG